MKNSAIFSDKDHNKLTYYECFESPLGVLCIGASDVGLRSITKITNEYPTAKPNEFTAETKIQLQKYFDRGLTKFEIPLDLSGYTEFSIRVWNQLLTIPYGKTISYMKLSVLLGDVKAIRAVGTANGRNPIPIIIPCHRVIGSDGSLTGFALGLEFKRSLLKLENPDKYSAHQGVLAL
ncbi:MAG: methylated-DNA--[protein]-cysteine S-methyltransferase [Saprospiraceae bacterium]|nr:methylated-DNA--[protein]-cysteine S-methyltransferase [Saprospiraceae bacterium]